MDVDVLTSSLALSRYYNSDEDANRSYVRARAHPYSKSSLSAFKLHGLQLASPIHEKNFHLPSPPPQKLVGEKGSFGNNLYSVRKWYC
jgi:hypothetical protein